MNIEELYSADFVEEINTESNGKAMKLFTPREVRLEVPQEEVNDSSSVSPKWKVSLKPLGDGEKEISLRKIGVDNTRLIFPFT